MAGSSLLTEEVLESITLAVTLGATREIAANFAGVSPAALSVWLKDGRNGTGTGLQTALYRSLRRARGAGAVKWLQDIENHTQRDWKAAAWKLGKCYPVTYGKHTPGDPKLDDPDDASDEYAAPAAFASTTEEEQEASLSDVIGW